MEEKTNILKIIEYEKEVDLYTQKVLSKKKNKKTPKLDADMESAVDFIMTRANFYSNILTKKLLLLQEENISYFTELDQRLKKRDRVIEKVIEKIEVDNMELRDAAHNVSDVLRYTIIIDDDSYTEKVDEYLHKIESLGYSVYKLKNKWGNEYYQGINVSFKDDCDFIFEVQFHTPNGYAIKEGKLRNVYNIIRDKDSPSDLVLKSNAIRKFYQSQVKIPKGAKEYQYESNVKRMG